MRSLADAVDETAERTGFSGVVRVDRAGRTELCSAFGWADRAHHVPHTVHTQLAIASGSKGFTALVVMSLLERGLLDLGTTARSLLADDLALIAPDVTVEHLLRSGIGDYLDEHDLEVTDYVLTLPVHQLDSTEQYLPVLEGHETAFAAGARFAYNNGGYVVLALLAERASGVAFHELVRTLVCEPAGMVDTAFLRSDELPGRAARGYLHRHGLRTNVLHLPVVGSGDGGAYSTAADLAEFWKALFAGRIVSRASVAAMLDPRSDWPEEHQRFGLGFHLRASGDGVWLEGYDAGVSFVSAHDPATTTTCTVMANWTDGAWLMVRLLEEQFGL
ncbi:serine hydrolase [Angustibacter sp. Root456]|uniref:serine hydrolase domain-containing protein n=1 Tax=Angustibacter sp. Root456 TaxID=1736539 RepID=UPI0006F5FF05|nr:serine hydrolase domain-containing protein [Angustibacter sp. Root456]KQX61723.1 serine hydrolase [Angustibacter sp. Root456]